MRFRSHARWFGPGAAILALAGCASRPPGPPPAPSTPVNYYVRVLRAGVDRYDVSLAADRVRSDSIDFVLPVWIPGRYASGAGAATVESFSVRDGHGSPIATRRLGPDRWRLYPGRSDYLTIGYQVVPGAGAGPLAFRPLLDVSSGYALGAMLFGHLEGHETRPVTVAFELPSRWQAITPLAPSSPRRYDAPSFAALAGTPIILGDRMRDYKLFVEGRTHQIVVLGTGDEFVPDSLLSLVGETVRHGTRFYGPPPPYERYLFAIRFVPPGTAGIGAIGQASSSVYFLPILESGRVREAGIGAVLLHQYLHAWLPGTFGPVDLLDPVFYAPPAVPDLWLIEGAAEYYARLLPTRHGEAGRPEFYDAMGELLTWWREHGGGAWIDVVGLEPGDGRDDAAARLVVGGALAAFVVDIAIRGDTHAEVGLEQVLHYLQRGTPRSGYDPASVWGEAAAALGVPPEALSPLSRGASLSIEEGLRRAGLRVVETAERRRTLGAGLHVGSAARFVVRDVERGGTAASAGLREGDQLVAINGTPISPDETVATRYALTNYIRDAATGARINFEVIRDGERVERTGTVRENRVPHMRIEEVAGSSATALLVRSSLFNPPVMATGR